ncbi:MAG: DUF502 domain-containing protein [Nitrospira sp.]|nr:DUF502 domain-containing protein [Nitrospira sp.]
MMSLHNIRARSRPQRMLKTALKRYFLTGLLVVIPIWGTVLILKTLFVTMDGILGDILARWAPNHYVPGIGIALLIILIFSMGVLTANFMGRAIVKIWEDWVNRLPLVRGIYSTIKSMMDILSFSDRESYRRVVLIQFPKNGHYCFAFVTGVTKSESSVLGQEPLIHVYVPTSPNPTSGYFLLVPEREVTSVDISVDEAMKLIVSGGLYSPSTPLAPLLNRDAKWSQVKQPNAGVPIA